MILVGSRTQKYNSLYSLYYYKLLSSENYSLTVRVLAVSALPSPMETQTADQFGPGGNNKNDGYQNSYNQNSHTQDSSFHNRRSSRFSDNGECNYDRRSPSNHHDDAAGSFENPPSNSHVGFGGRGDRFHGGSLAKLFVGSVPKTATEEDIRLAFEKEGNVIEVALVKDKNTGQQQSYCFVKYATSEEADRAIKALHNQHTLPGGNAPIRVKYADGERVRLGGAATDHKLYLFAINKQATEMEVEEIFAPYGRVEDVHLLRDEMKQSRGCGFVKYSHRDMALEAISALNGAYTMRGCNQPLIVRFADAKKPKAGDSSFPRGGGPGFEGPGYGSRFQWPMQRSDHNYGESMGDHGHHNPWQPIGQQNMGPPPNVGVHGPGNQLPPMSGDLPVPFNQGGFGGPPAGAFQGPFIPSTGHQMQPIQNSFQSSHHLQPSLPINPHAAAPSYPNTQMPHLAQQNMPPIPGQPSYNQPLPSQQQLHGFTDPAVSSAAPRNHLPIGLHPHLGLAVPNQPHNSAHVQQQQPQFLQQSPSQSAWTLSQHEQPLQASLQSSQQPFSQSQQVQQMQPSVTHQSSQPAGPQWTGMAPHTGASVPASTLPTDVPSATKITPASTTSVAQAATSKQSDWSEHTSPEGNKYYYNSETCESQWEKPEELCTSEDQQQKPLVQFPQAQQNPQAPSNQHGQEMQFPSQLQSQYHQ
ncbi:Flowering time control protein FCA [Linum perenne]